MSDTEGGDRYHEAITLEVGVTYNFDTSGGDVDWFQFWAQGDRIYTIIIVAEGLAQGRTSTPDLSTTPFAAPGVLMPPQSRTYFADGAYRVGDYNYSRLTLDTASPGEVILFPWEQFDPNDYSGWYRSTIGFNNYGLWSGEVFDYSVTVVSGDARGFYADEWAEGWSTAARFERGGSASQAPKETLGGHIGFYDEDVNGPQRGVHDKDSFIAYLRAGFDYDVVVSTKGKDGLKYIKVDVTTMEGRVGGGSYSPATKAYRGGDAVAGISLEGRAKWEPGEEVPVLITVSGARKHGTWERGRGAYTVEVNHADDRGDNLNTPDEIARNSTRTGRIDKVEQPSHAKTFGDEDWFKIKGGVLKGYTYLVTTLSNSKSLANLQVAIHNNIGGALAGFTNNWLVYRSRQTETAWLSVQAAADLEIGKYTVQFGQYEGDVKIGTVRKDKARGGKKDDYFQLGKGKDGAWGGDGDDEMHGGGDADRLIGGAGDDTASGDAGNDRLFGGAGEDTLSGGAGKDQVKGGAGNDRAHGGAGADKIAGNGGDDVLRGEGANDRIVGGAGDDGLYGGPGNDRLIGGAGDDGLWGGVGDDVALGGPGADTFAGGDGADAFKGGDDADVAFGDAGNDTLEGEAGHDRLYGGAGADKLFGGTEGDTLLGGDGPDKLYGGDGWDRVSGQNGADALFGGNGRDDVEGGAGADILGGGAGRDTIRAQLDGDVIRPGDDRDADVILFAAAGQAAAGTVTKVEGLGPGDSLDFTGLGIEIWRLNDAGGVAPFAGGGEASVRRSGRDLQFDLDGDGAADRILRFEDRAALDGATLIHPLDPYAAALAGASAPITSAAEHASLSGTSGDDVIRGYSGADTVDGLAGDDVLDVGGAPDQTLVEVPFSRGGTVTRPGPNNNQRVVSENWDQDLIVFRPWYSLATVKTGPQTYELAGGVPRALLTVTNFQPGHDRIVLFAEDFGWDVLDGLEGRDFSLPPFTNSYSAHANIFVPIKDTGRFASFYVQTGAQTGRPDDAAEMLDPANWLVV